MAHPHPHHRVSHSTTGAPVRPHKKPEEEEKEWEEGWAIDINDLKVEPTPFAGGAFGRVHRGEYFGKPVCVKVVNARKWEAIELKLVEREITALKKLSHPNLLQLIGTVDREAEGEFWIVTEYVAGGTARHAILQLNVDISWETRTRMAYEAASALGFLHEKKLIHRDIKSENLLVDANLHVKLCDFGMARNMTETKRKQHMTLCGTEEFMAPEVTFGMDYDASCDMFSYGMFLCELITRQKIEQALPRTPQNGFCLDYNGLRRITPPSCPPKLLNLAIQCCEYEAKLRPDAKQACQILQEIMSEFPSGGEMVSEFHGTRQKFLRKLRTVEKKKHDLVEKK